MKIVSHNEQEHWLKVEPQCLEDLWYLQKIIQPGDAVEGGSFRRFKVDGAEKDSGEKKKIHVVVRAEQVEFAENASILRVTGVIENGTPQEYVAKGQHHTLDVDIHQRVKIFKILTPYDWSLLKEAKQKAQHVKAFLIVLDEHQATLAELSLQGIKFYGEINFKGTKKDPKMFEEAKKAYFSEIAKTMDNKEKNVVAGPGFTKENFQKYLKEKHPALLKTTSFEYASTAEKSGVYELLKRGLVEKAMGEQKIAQEFGLLEKFKQSIGKDDHKNVYGIKDVQKAVQANAVEHLMISDTLVKDPTISKIMENARKTGAKLHVFNSENETGQELKHYGMVALLRYPLYIT
jgi:protein pelota